MTLKDLLDKNVKMVLEARAVKFKSEASTFSLEAQGHLSRYQDPSSGYLAFDKIKYKICEQEEVELEDALVNKDYIICIGLPGNK